MQKQYENTERTFEVGYPKTSALSLNNDFKVISGGPLMKRIYMKDRKF